MALDSVTSFLRLKSNVANTCKCMGQSQLLAEILQCNGGKLKKLRASNVFPLFIM